MAESDDELKQRLENLLGSKFDPAAFLNAQKVLGNQELRNTLDQLHEGMDRLTEQAEQQLVVLKNQIAFLAKDGDVSPRQHALLKREITLQEQLVSKLRDAHNQLISNIISFPADYAPKAGELLSTKARVEIKSLILPIENELDTVRKSIGGQHTAPLSTPKKPTSSSSNSSSETGIAVAAMSTTQPEPEAVKSPRVNQNTQIVASEPLQEAFEMAKIVTKAAACIAGVVTAVALYALEVGLKALGTGLNAAKKSIQSHAQKQQQLPAPESSKDATSKPTSTRGHTAAAGVMSLGADISTGLGSMLGAAAKGIEHLIRADKKDQQPSAEPEQTNKPRK